MTRAYYRDAVGAIVVFDATRTKTFDEVAKWKNDLDEKVQLPDGSRVPAVLIANKCDIAPRDSVINEPKVLDRFCEEHGFRAWFACSAKENIRIDESARFLIAQVSCACFTSVFLTQLTSVCCLQILETQRAVDNATTDQERSVIVLGNRPAAEASRERDRCSC